MANAIPVHHDKLKPPKEPQKDPAVVDQVPASVEPAEGQEVPRGVPYKIGKAVRVDY